VAGADVKELLEVGEAGDRESAQTLPNAAQTAFGELERLGKPVVAAVNGPALGGGNELVLACAYVVADARARFGQPEINLNLLPGYGGTQRLTRRLHAVARGEAGLAEATRLMMGGRAIDAEEAKALGFVDEVVGTTPSVPVERAVEVCAPVLRRRGPPGRGAGGAPGGVPGAASRLRSRLDATSASLRGPRWPAAAQARAGGRAGSVDRILEALAVKGSEEGQAGGPGPMRGSSSPRRSVDPESGPAGHPRLPGAQRAPAHSDTVSVPPTAETPRRGAGGGRASCCPCNAAFFPGRHPGPASTCTGWA
jgi:acrylyl-CoA reductase (NADPH)/3-hydroxypropionyl-CoA dehydratase/3-hydroxypropionyl-CoA synthetase